MKNKRNPELVETIMLANKQNHLELAKKLSGSTRKQKRINLDQLDKIDDEKVLIIGKVLGKGNISKKKKIRALSVSESAIEKLNKAGCEFKTIKEELIKGKIEDFKII